MNPAAPVTNIVFAVRICAENLQLKIRDLEHADKTSIGCPLRASSPRGITDNTARLSVMQLMSALGG